MSGKLEERGWRDHREAVEWDFSWDGTLLNGRGMEINI